MSRQVQNKKWKSMSSGIPKYLRQKYLTGQPNTQNQFQLDVVSIKGRGSAKLHQQNSSSLSSKSGYHYNYSRSSSKNSPRPFESARVLTQTPTNSEVKLTPISTKIHQALNRTSVTTNKSLGSQSARSHKMTITTSAQQKRLQTKRLNQQQQVQKGRLAMFSINSLNSNGSKIMSPSATTRASTIMNQTGPFGQRLSSAKVTPVLSSRKQDKSSPVIRDLASQAISIVGSPFTVVVQERRSNNAVTSPKIHDKPSITPVRRSMISSQSLTNLSTKSLKPIKSPQSQLNQNCSGTFYQRSGSASSFLKQQYNFQSKRKEANPRIDINGYGRGSIAYRQSLHRSSNSFGNANSKSIIILGTPSPMKQKKSAAWKQNWNYITQSPIQQNRDSTSHQNQQLSILKDLHKFVLLLLTQILSTYNKQKSFYAITLSAYKQVEVQVPDINQTMKKLLLQRLGCTLWDQKPVRKTLNFLVQILECLQYVINKSGQKNQFIGLSTLRNQQIILYQAIFESFLISHQVQFPLLKVIQSQSPMHYFSIQCQQLEKELEQISHSDPLINQFNSALHDKRIFLVEKLRDLTGIDLAISKRHNENGLPIFIIPRDSPFQLNYIISLIAQIDGVNRLTKLPHKKQFESKAKFVPYFFKFQQSSDPIDFADNLVQIDNFLNNVVRKLSYTEFVKEFDWKKNIKHSYVNQITSQNHPLSQPSPLRKSLDGDLKFASFLTMLRNELVVNGGEAGYRALQFALKDKHYEKLIEHILQSQSYLNQAHRHLIVQLLFNLLIVIVREQEFDYKSFCMVAEKILKLQVRQGGDWSQMMYGKEFAGGKNIEDFFTDKNIMWEIRNLNANINKQIFGIKIIPSLSFVREEMKRVLGYILKQRKLHLVSGLKLTSSNDEQKVEDQKLKNSTKNGKKSDLSLKLWSFYSPGCNYIYVNEQQINELLHTAPKSQQQIRKLKQKLVKSIIQDIAFAKTNLVSNQYQKSERGNDQLKHNMIKGISHQLALVESVSRLYKRFKSYPPQRFHQYSPVQLAKKRKSITEQTKSMKKFYQLQNMGDKVQTSTALLKEIIKLNKHFNY